MKSILGIILLSMSVSMAFAQTLIKITYHDTIRNDGIIYFHGQSKTVTFGYFIPSCTWDEIPDSVYEVEVILDSKRYSFGQLYKLDLVGAKDMLFTLKNDTSTLPRIIEQRGYSLSILGSRNKLPNNNSNELIILK